MELQVKVMEMQVDQETHHQLVHHKVIMEEHLYSYFHTITLEEVVVQEQLEELVLLVLQQGVQEELVLLTQFLVQQ
ncbi:MAG: hypothetical protein EBR82_88315 [Caulobacteraceae bacterium]|nr:hypothetical protein [Caulobacteraceae bacterium]